MNRKVKFSHIIFFNLILILVLVFGTTSPVLAAPEDTITGSLTLIPTFECVSVYASFSGDSDANNTVLLEYKPASSGVWIRGMDMTPDRRSSVPSEYQNQWRASILGLDPDTDYNVRVTFSDGVVSGTNPVTGTVRTRNDDFDSLSYSENEYYVATTGDDISGTGTESNPWRTIQHAVDNIIAAGDTIYVKAGTYDEGTAIWVEVSGTADNYITIRNYADDHVIIDATNNAESIPREPYHPYSGGFQILGNYVRVKGFEIIGAEIGIYVGSRWLPSYDSWHPHDVVIEDCVFQDPKTMASSPGIYTPIWIGGIGDSHLTDVENITVQNNDLYLVEPPGAADFYSTSGPGIWMYNANGGHVIRNNNIYFTGTVPLSVHGRDGINSSPNFQIDYTIRDTDIYGNYIQGSTDDAISLDGNAANVRVWKNTITRSSLGVSVAPAYIGPVYFFRNVLHDPERHWGDSSGWIKAGESGTGHCYFYHNTVVYDDLNVGEGTPSAYGYTQWGGDDASTNLYLLNNIIETDGPIGSSNVRWPKMDYDLLYNHFDNTPKTYWAKWADTAIGPRSNTNAENLAVFQSYTNNLGDPQEVNGVAGQATFVDRANDDFHLANGSPGIDQGVLIYGFNDANSPWPYNSSGPDIGAYECGVDESNPPFLSGHNPAIDATDVFPNTDIVVHVQDTQTGVNLGTIIMTVEGATVTPSITGSMNDYILTYNPPADFSENQEVNVSVEAEDYAATPNLMNEAYSFRIIVDFGDIPVITPIEDEVIDEMSPLTINVNATDADSWPYSPLVYSASNLPPGATFNTSTHVFSWTPSYIQAGIYPDISFEVTDGLNSVSESLTITVNNTNRQPTADAGPDQQVLVNNLVTLDGSSSSDQDSGDTLTYAWTQTGGQALVLSGNTTASPTFTPVAADTYVFSLVVNDGTIDSNGDSVSITAVTWPVLPVRVNAGGSEYTDTGSNLWWADQAYAAGFWGYVGGSPTDRGSIAISNTSDDPIYQTERWGLSSYQFDLGNGTYDVILHLAETYTGITGAGQRVFDVNIEGQLVLDNLDMFAEAGGRNAALVKTVNDVTVTDGQLSIIFTQIVEDPLINGIEITDAAGNQPPVATNDSYSVTVDGNLDVPSPGVLANDYDTDEDALTAQLVSDVSNGNLILNADGSFNYTPNPSYIGGDSFTYRVNDGQVNSNTATVSLTINGSNQPPVLTPIGNKSVTAGQTLQFIIFGTDPNDNTLIFSAPSLPSGASFNGTTRTFTWITDSSMAGTFANATFLVSDGALTDSEEITINVNAVSSPDDGGVISGGGGGGSGARGVTNIAGLITPDGILASDINAASSDLQVYLALRSGTSCTIGGSGIIYWLSIKASSENDIVPDPPEGWLPVTPAYTMEPEGATFTPSVTCTFNYGLWPLPEGANENKIAVMHWDPISRQWIPMETQIDPENNSAATELHHFSLYQVMVPIRPANFTITGFTATPQEIEPGNDVNISAIITNTGDLTGSYEVILIIDGETLETKQLTLDGGAVETLNFSTITNTIGEHEACIGDCTVTFTVREPETPATFVTNNLIITPTIINIGESIEIDVLVSNIGDLPGSYETVLKVDNTAIQNQEVTLGGGESKMISYSITPESVGELSINIDNLYAKCEVKEPAATDTEEDTIVIIEPEIRHFNMIPVFDTETGKLISARIDYQINEFEDPNSETELILKVFFNGEPLEQIPVLSLNQLQDDIINGSLGYIPSLGWNVGTYSFQAELADGEIPVQSTEQTQLTVTPESITRAVSWKTLGVVIGSMVLVIALTVALVLYRRRDMLRDYIE